ncbi:MAG: M14 family zinc carboxypeptidase [Bacteroidota bacterium]
MKKLFPLSLLLVFTCFFSSAQSFDHRKADSLLNVNGEVYFKFHVFDKESINELSRIISIDNVRGDEVYAYANRSEFPGFAKLGYDITILTPPGSMYSDAELMKPEGTPKSKGPATWNFYPTYQQYVDTMHYFASAYPSLCKLDTIGITGAGRLILVVKISKDVNTDGAKPQFLYTSSIHGDETTGYIGMMHLIDYLLSNYGTDQRITRMVDSIEIFINPLANPDGTYHGGNNSVNGAIRGNANGIDLNRNYPDPADGQHPDGNAWQIETMAFMNYANVMGFTMSANFHGGSEVFNYPWDTWSKLSADDSWWQFVGREYADTVHVYGPSNYFRDEQNGVTNGYAWYRITGGRQDYMNYWHYCREVTIELSSTKLLPASQLVNYWNYNYRSYLNYIEQVSFGIHGIVSDTVTGDPLVAKINIAGHDIDNSFIYSRSSTGFYERVIDHGSWNLTFSRAGYFTKTVNNVEVNRFSGTYLDVKLKPLTYGTGELNSVSLTIYPVPAKSDIHIVFPETDSRSWRLDVVNSLGLSVYSSELITSGQLVHTLSVSAFPDGVYFVVLSNNNGVYRRQIIVRH